MRFQWDGDRTFEWTQSRNPIATASKKIVTCTAELCKGSSTGINFDGLTRSSAQTHTLLDGNADGGWWFSVGYRIPHNGGNPGYHDNGSKYHVAKQTRLFVLACVEGYKMVGDKCVEKGILSIKYEMQIK